MPLKNALREFSFFALTPIHTKEDSTSFILFAVGFEFEAFKLKPVFDEC